MIFKKFIFSAILCSCQAIAVAAIPTPDHFMHTLSDNIKLKNLSLLGAHDAGTYALDPRLGVSPDEAGSFIYKIGSTPFLGSIVNYTLIKGWSQTQTHNIAGQLTDGVRYFDLRIVVDRQGQFRVCHGLYGPLINDILTQLNIFLNAHPGEMIFLDFGHLFNQTGHNMDPVQQSQLISKIQQSLGGRIAPPSYGVDVTLGQMRQTQSQVIIFWEDTNIARSFPNLLWSRAIFLSSTWHNATNWDALEAGLNEGMASPPSGKFYVNQAILTPDAEMVATHLCSNLLSVEADTNAQIMPWYAQKAATGMPGNILMVDNEASIYKKAFQISMSYNSHLTQ